MSPGGSAAEDCSSLTISQHLTRIEAPPLVEPPDLKLLLEQLTYCISLAKRLADAALTEALKK
jgi:hypothetical protein